VRIEKRDRGPSVSRSLEAAPVTHRRVTKTSKESFADLLSSEEHSTLQSMLEEVMRLGDLLAQRRTLEDLEAYKNAVRQFVRYSVERSLRLKKGRRMSRSVSLLVETVDTALADLTELVLTRETPRIEILAKLEMIKGLLIDCSR
jgi:uncharacterized protein YaaR (DUF327 family)